MRCLLLVWYSCDILCGAENPPQKMPKFSSMENICFYAQYTMLLHDTSNLGQQGLKTRRSTQGCAYCGVNNVPLNFGSQTSKK